MENTENTIPAIPANADADTALRIITEYRKQIEEQTAKTNDAFVKLKENLTKAEKAINRLEGQKDLLNAFEQHYKQASPVRQVPATQPT